MSESSTLLHEFLSDTLSQELLLNSFFVIKYHTMKTANEYVGAMPPLPQQPLLEELASLWEPPLPAGLPVWTLSMWKAENGHPPSISHTVFKLVLQGKDEKLISSLK